MRAETGAAVAALTNGVEHGPARVCENSRRSLSGELNFHSLARRGKQGQIQIHLLFFCRGNFLKKESEKAWQFPVNGVEPNSSERK
jgi:hypothetical protein